jgi:Tol biopolymer transport system component
VKFVAGGEPANLTAALDLNIQRDDNVSGLQISPDGNLIAFPAAGPGRSGRAEISSWVMPVPLGGAPRRVLGGGDESLTWSPDGARIAFVRTGGSAGDSVWIADTDGQHAKELLRPHGGRHTHWLRWSRDGRFVYFNYGPQPLNIEPTQIARVPAAGGALEIVVSSSRRAVFPFPDAENRGLYYAANPDTVDLGLWWRDLSTGRDYRLINGLGDYAAPSVSADGSRMVAAAMASQQYIARVENVDLPAPSVTRTTDVLSGDLEPAWSADGTRVVFSSLRGGDRNIWIARGDFSAAMPVTFGTAIDEHPAFSPDSQEIAFVSDRGGKRGVWLVSTDGRPPHLLVESDVLGSVSWSPDGRDLVYSQATGELPQLAVVSRASGQVRPLLVDGAGTGPSWSPRGDVIAYLETLPGSAPRVRFVDPKGQRVASPLASRQGELANGVIAWSPDGRRLVSTILLPTGAMTLWVLDLNDAARTRQLVELPAGATLQGLTWTRDGRGLTFGLVTKTGDVMLAQRAR